ncbi:MAG TPA: hypothetical protein VGG72_11045 [Bryobacteraceae bacterium]
MEFQLEALSECSAPGIINGHDRAHLRSLHDCLGFTAILGSISRSLCEKQIDSALIVVVAALEESVFLEEPPQPIFGFSPLV